MILLTRVAGALPTSRPPTKETISTLYFTTNKGTISHLGRQTPERGTSPRRWGLFEVWLSNLGTIPWSWKLNHNTGHIWWHQSTKSSGCAPQMEDLLGLVRPKDCLSKRNISLCYWFQCCERAMGESERGSCYNDWGMFPVFVQLFPRIRTTNHVVWDTQFMKN